MSSKTIIPIIDHTQLTPEVLSAPFTEGQPVSDTLLRHLKDLRISVTDRCNFRCTYCMPRAIFDKDYPFLAHSDLLSFEEIARLARIFARLGVDKLRITGGEPLMRKQLENLILQLSQIYTPAGKKVEITLTTNGVLLARYAQQLKDVGVNRVTVSLDALDQDLFAQMSDSKSQVKQVLEGIDAASKAGLDPVKVNMVVRKGLNDHQILPMVSYFRNTGHILRFIEFMDVGTTNGWNMTEVLTGKEIIEQINAVYPIEPVNPNYSGEVAKRWRFLDGAGEIGLITSVSNTFCSTCTRARLSPEGKLYLCLFADEGFDLRALVRSDLSDDEIAGHITSIWNNRKNRYSELRSENKATGPKIEMSYIGG